MGRGGCDNMRMLRFNAARIVGLVFLLNGLLFGGIGLVMRQVNADASAARTATAEATIVDVEARTHTDSDGDVTTSYYPVLEFEDADHVTHRATQNVSSGRYDVGTKTEVRYDPRDPEGNLVMTRDEGAVGLITTILVIMGGIFAVVGLVLSVVAFL